MQHIITFPGRPPTHNAERRKHWSSANHLSETWRLEGRLRARTLTPFDPTRKVVIEVAQGCTKNLPDPGSSYDVVKAIIDGLVDGGLLKDDSPKYVDRLTFLAPVKGQRDQLVIMITQEGLAEPRCPSCAELDAWAKFAGRPSGPCRDDWHRTHA